MVVNFVLKCCNNVALILKLIIMVLGQDLSENLRLPVSGYRSTVQRKWLVQGGTLEICTFLLKLGKNKMPVDKIKDTWYVPEKFGSDQPT